MKLFASIIATIFMLQASTPVLCASGCSDAVEKHLHETEFLACEMSGSCCLRATDEFYEETISACEAKGDETPCSSTKDCCTPCCAVPLCTCYYQDSHEFCFTSQPVILAGQLPSSNGTPHAGFCADCFQPPEAIS